VDAQVGKAIAGVGVVLALVAIWVDALAGQSYWSLDGTLGAFLLIMAIVGALAVAAGQNRAVLVIGGILLGFYGFYPAATATDQWHFLDAGAWLGLSGGALMTLGALAILAPAWLSTRTGASMDTPAAGLAAVGLVLSFVAIWPKADKDGSYWNAPSLGHSLAIVMIILAVAAALGIVGAVMMHSTAAAGLAATAGMIYCGTLLFVPVGDAFGQLGQLRLGGWLGFFGGILLAAGTMKLTRTAITTRTATATAMPTPAT
jgi:hypothetical protein